MGSSAREGRPKGRNPDARSEPREQGEAEAPTTSSQQVRLGSSRSERNSADPGEPEKDRPRSSRSTREGRHATSTPTGSDREQRLREGLEEVSGIRGTRLPTPAPRREVSPGRSSSRTMCPSPTNPPMTSTTITPKWVGGGGLRADHPIPSRENRTSGVAGTSGIDRSGAGRTAPRRGSRSALEGQPQRDQDAPDHPREREDMQTRRGT